MANDHQFIFTDESGHMDFSPKSSSHAVLTGITITNSVDDLMRDYWELRHFLYVNPVEFESNQGKYMNKRFHASEDPQEVRDLVFKLIDHHKNKILARSLIVEKAKVFNHLKMDGWLISRMYFFWLKSVYNRTNWIENKTSMQIIVDHTKTKRLRSAIESGLKTSIGRHGNGTPYLLHHTPSGCHPFIQLADYISWAVYRKYERGDLRSYGLIEEILDDEWKMI